VIHAVALRHALALVAVCTAAAAHAGCAATPAPETQAVTTGGMHRTPEALDLLSLLGPNATGVLRVDVRGALYHSWVRNLLVGVILARGEGAQEFMQGLDHTDELVVGFWDIPDEGRVPPMLLMARGDYRSLPLEDPAAGQTVAHYRQHELRAEDSLRVTVRLGDHTVLNGERELVVAALDVIDGVSSASGPRGALITGAMERVGLREHTLALALAARVLMPPERNAARRLAAGAGLLGRTSLRRSPRRASSPFADQSAPAVFLAVIDNSLQLLRQSPEVACSRRWSLRELERVELRTEGNDLLAAFAPRSGHVQDVERFSRALTTCRTYPVRTSG
jgi:hypothetical protein